jgi:hypothetical protein
MACGPTPGLPNLSRACTFLTEQLAIASVRRLLGVLLRAFLFGTQNSEVETNRSIAGTRKQLSGRLLLVHPARLERATP